MEEMILIFFFNYFLDYVTVLLKCQQFASHFFLSVFLLSNENTIWPMYII